MPQTFSSHLAPAPLNATRVVSALCVVATAPAWFVADEFVLGLVLLLAGVGLAAVSGSPFGVGASLLRDLLLIGLGLGVVRTISLAARLDNVSMVQFTLALGGAVVLPYVVSRWVFRDRAVSFPWRPRAKWHAWQWWWLIGVLVLGLTLLPWYFIASGVYMNWPVVDTLDLRVRLLIGVSAVGIWDELFFICTVFVLLLRHFPMWLANLLQAVVFVSFLWELGYQSWGPLLTIPFALVQGFIFVKSRSLTYVVIVHLLFDAVVFGVLVYAHHPDLLTR